MINYILPAILIGVNAGFSPGPLMTLVISQTLKHGIKEGIKVALAPFITDIPIVVIITSILSLLSSINAFLAIVSFLGASYLVYMAYESFKIKGIDLDKINNVQPKSLRKGIITNLLNPSPYLFYFTVGGPFLLKSMKTNLIYGILFILSFLLCLVLSKVLLAFISEHSRKFLKSKVYLYINKALALLLLFFAYKLILEGISYIKL